MEFIYCSNLFCTGITILLTTKHYCTCDFFLANAL